MSEHEELPKFTLKNVLMDIYNGIHALVFDPFCSRIVIPVVITLTSIVTKAIILNVPYTEIDFKTYMQQIQKINDGELDYSLISGDSGPIVYPAGFVQIFQFLYYLSGNNIDIEFCQGIFGYLMVATNILITVSYTSGKSVAPWVFFLLILSKRLFSIYVLRLFNDCFTTFFVVASIVVLQIASKLYYHKYTAVSFLLLMIGSDIYSIAVSIKMNALLYFPAYLLTTYFVSGENILKTLACILVFIIIQIQVSWKFLLPFFWDEEAQYIRLKYLTNAFDFNRKFLYEWTVNWRFLSEEVFLSDYFSRALLLCHILVLAIFLFTRYISPRITGKSIVVLSSQLFKKPWVNYALPNSLYLNTETGPHLILMLFATTNLIGVLFARSLHYQFLSWYCWSLPYLLYVTGWNIFISLGVWLIHEWSWNVFPSTSGSSLSLIIILAFILIRIWSRKSIWFASTDEFKISEEKKKI